MQGACSSGVEQVIHSFIHGTNDLKALLLQHTDVIFECKGCRALFRQLKQFVNHKAECNADIKHGLTFNGTDLDLRAGNDLDNTLQWQLPPPQFPAIIEKHSEPCSPQKSAPPEPTEQDDLPPIFPTCTNGDTSEDKTAEDVIVYGSNCPVCGKTFATKNNCRRHVREMHGMNPISKPRPLKQEQHEMITQAKELCPICGAENETKFDLRRHLVQHHQLTMMDACSLSEKEIPLSSSLPTMVKPIAGVVAQPIAENSSIPASKRKVPCPLCGVILYDKWTTRKHLMGKVHGKTPEEADALLKPTMNKIKSEYDEEVRNETKKSQTNNQQVPPQNGHKEQSDKQSDGFGDPDKISCPICAKMWHKSNLRNHLFYGHHMKTSEVEHVLKKLKNPLVDHSKVETTPTERTPCPKCDRSFKHWYNARRHLREHHGMLHDETVKMIRPPSEKKRQAIDNLIVEAVSTENRVHIEKSTVTIQAVAAPITTTKSPRSTPSPDSENSALIQLRTGSIVKVEIKPGPFVAIPNNKCFKCNRILSSRVSMKAHLMEVHHEVFQGDPDWLDLLVDDENKKNLKMQFKADVEEKKENLQIKCPICRMRGDIQDLKLHLKQAHKKNKREIDDLVELGMIEVEPKKPRISYSPATSESRFSSSSGSPLPIVANVANNDHPKLVTKLPSSPLMPDSKTAKL